MLLCATAAAADAACTADASLASRKELLFKTLFREHIFPFHDRIAEVAALIAEQAFEWLDAPVQRIGGLDVPVPFSPPLEDYYIPNVDKIVAAVKTAVSS
ncbi:hypothetical protein FBQ87_08635 [Sphingobacteriales bacterium CHB3]|nr:hypothetical protein [Sphingobacteriales bacterium CHB3]